MSSSCCRLSTWLGCSAKATTSAYSWAVSSIARPSARHRVRDRIDRERAELDVRRVAARAPAHDRPQPRREFRQLERLDEVVVRAGVEAAHAVRQAIARGQDQHGRRLGRLPDRRQQREPVAVGEAEIEHDAAYWPGQAGARGREALDPVEHVTVADEVIANGRPERRIVLDQENAHCA